MAEEGAAGRFLVARGGLIDGGYLKGVWLVGGRGKMVGCTSFLLQSVIYSTIDHGVSRSLDIGFLPVAYPRPRVSRSSPNCYYAYLQASSL